MHILLKMLLMKKITLLFILTLPSLFLFSQNSFIQVDQFGYYPDAPKVAVLRNPQLGFNSSENYSAPSTLELREESTGAVVFSGSPTSWNGGGTDAYSGDQGWHFDFSSFSTVGEYYVHDPTNDEQSHVFSISENPYIDVLKAAAKAFYYNRCNAPKSLPFADSNWVDGNNFHHPLQDFNCRYIYDAGNLALEKDLSGGWFDAGDYNKYVTFAQGALHNLLSAFEANPSLFADSWNLPESGNGLPDLLDEVKWELDWMQKMVNPDGSVYIKMGSQNHQENVGSPPSVNIDQRFYGPICTSASASAASTFAHAALVFETWPGYGNYADTLENLAVDAFAFALPYLDGDSLQTDCDDLSIVAGDADMSTEEQVRVMVTAAIYLFELTGDNAYQQVILDHAESTQPLHPTSRFWGPYTVPLEDALLRYTTLPGADNSLSNTIISAITDEVSNNWNNFYGMNDLTLYRDFMPEWSYHWGSNRPKAHYGILNQLIADYGINHDEESLRQKAEELLHAFHGVNPLGMVYLSNMYSHGAEHSANEIYHIWFADQTDYDHALNSLYGPAPGFVVGGPNKDFSVPSISPPAGQPTTKSYLDWNTGWPENSWEITEPSISYQAAYVRLLSQVIGWRGYSPTTMAPDVEVDSDCIKIYPNPAVNYFVIHGVLGLYDLDIINSVGQTVRTIPNVGVEQIVNINGLGAGIYLVRVENQANNLLFFQNIIKQ